jgi:hypothetical protein
MGFERNYRVYNPSKQLNKKLSTLQPQLKFNPWFITGLVDGEGCFSITFFQKGKFYFGPLFMIQLHSRDSLLLKKIHSLFGVGNIININRTNKNPTVEFRVSSIKDLNEIIIPHFENYPLLSNKRSDFEI